MPKVGCQERQLRVHIGPRAIPAKQCVDSEGMPEVVDARRESVGGFNAALFKERLDAIGESGASVRAAATDRVPDQRCTRRRWEFQSGSGRKISINLIGNTFMDRQQSCLIELRSPNMQCGLLPVIVAFDQVQQLPAPDSGGEEQDDASRVSSGRSGVERLRFNREAASSKRATSDSVKMCGRMR